MKCLREGNQAAIRDTPFTDRLLEATFSFANLACTSLILTAGGASVGILAFLGTAGTTAAQANPPRRTRRLT